MQSLKLFFVVLFTVALSACATTPCEPIIKTKTIVWIPDNEALATTAIPTPPDKAQYRSLSLEQREVVLSRYIIDLLKALSDANERMSILAYSLHKAEQYYDESQSNQTEESK